MYTITNLQLEITNTWRPAVVLCWSTTYLLSLALREHKTQQLLVPFELSFPWFQKKGNYWQQRWTQHRCRRNSDWERRYRTRSWWGCYPLLQNPREEEEDWDFLHTGFGNQCHNTSCQSRSSQTDYNKERWHTQLPLLDSHIRPDPQKLGPYLPQYQPKLWKGPVLLQL